MSEEQEVRQIETALLKLLDRISAEDADDASILVRDHGLRSVAELATMSRDQHQARNIIRQPVRGACFHAVAILGRRLHELNVNLVGLSDKLLNAARDEEQAGDWASVLNNAWDGIGSWRA